MIYIKLFLEFLYVGLFSLGGGYATIPLIQERVIGVHGWISTAEFIDMITISQMTPGPLTLNISTFVGLNIAGIFGALVATIAAASFGVSLTVLIYSSYKKAKSKKYWDLFLKSLRISSTALIMLATVSIFQLLLIPNNTFDGAVLIPFVLLLIVAWRLKMDTMLILLFSGVIGAILF